MLSCSEATWTFFDSFGFRFLDLLGIPGALSCLLLIIGNQEAYVFSVRFSMNQEVSLSVCWEQALLSALRKAKHCYLSAFELVLRPVLVVFSHICTEYSREMSEYLQNFLSTYFFFLWYFVLSVLLSWFPWTLNSFPSTQEIFQALPGIPRPALWPGNSGRWASHRTYVTCSP